MATTIVPSSREEARDLILSGNAIRITPDELRRFDRIIGATANVWAGYVDGELLAIWGLVTPTLLSDSAYLWLFTTDSVGEHEFVLVRRSQIAIKEMLKRYPRIIGHCVADAERSIRWLKWLGATFGELDGDLRPFVIRSRDG